MPEQQYLFCTYRIWSAKGTWKKWNQKKYFRRSNRYLNPTESTEEGWQDGWIRYNGQIYAYNEDIMTFLVMGVDNDDVVKKAKAV